MKRIGILTYHCVPNFGAQLQAISTVGYLKKKGYEPIVLHWYPKDLEMMYDKRIPAEQVKCHQDFTEQILPLSKLCRNEEDLIAEIERLKLDGIIAGSDAIFKYIPQSRRKHFSKRKLQYIHRKTISVEDIKMNPFFCDYYERMSHEIPICAFSVSSQNCPYMDLNANEKDFFSKNLNHYKYISVRDEWTKGMVEALTGIQNVRLSPDPVFSFNRNCYVDIPSKETITNRYSLPENYVLLSFSNHFLSNEQIKSIANELELNSLTPVLLPMPESDMDLEIRHKVVLPLSPLDWYALIKHSKGYIGERMHPIVVALHNAVPFYCFDEYGTVKKTLWGLRKEYLIESSKTFHILDKAGMTNWMYSYKSRTKVPVAKEIVTKLLSFDIQKVKSFSDAYQKYYEECMNEMLTYLKK